MAATVPSFGDPCLINRLDDILDLAEDVAQSLHLYHVTATTAEAGRLADLAVQSAGALQRAVAGLDSVPTCARPRPVRRGRWARGQADHVYARRCRSCSRRTDTAQLVKLKAIYELLEELTDKCKHAAAEVQALALR